MLQSVVVSSRNYPAAIASSPGSRMDRSCNLLHSSKWCWHATGFLKYRYRMVKRGGASVWLTSKVYSVSNSTWEFKIDNTFNTRMDELSTALLSTCVHYYQKYKELGCKVQEWCSSPSITSSAWIFCWTLSMYISSILACGQTFCAQETCMSCLRTGIGRTSAMWHMFRTCKNHKERLTPQPFVTEPLRWEEHHRRLNS